ncbi:hypothetical protein C0995_015442 [Termitomyces sp. Mi166|nr:hypothetical protein C0995_015442 [Termitomyces sp. Mi166\
MGYSYESEDPLTLAIAPPPNETPEQRAAREFAEAQAKKVSDEIDEQLRKEREGDKKKKKPVKLLLLGRSKIITGFSSLTPTSRPKRKWKDRNPQKYSFSLLFSRQFKLTYTSHPADFQLTYARREWSEERASWRAVIQLNLVRNVNCIIEHLNQEMAGYVDGHNSDDSSDEVQIVRRKAKALPPLRFREHHRLLRLRLTSLARVQQDLERKLGEASTEVHTTPYMTAAPFEHAPSNRRALQEFSINSNNGWKSALVKLRPMRTARPEVGEDQRKAQDVEDDIAEVLDASKDDIKALWEDPVVTEMLTRRKARIEDSPGFFLNDAERIASRNYQPTDDDVIRARLRTLGVQEYRFVFDSGTLLLKATNPIQLLKSDRSDGWAGVAFGLDDDALVLNKCDLLQAKLQRGVRIRDSVPSFGDRKNDLQTATRYFQQHFKDISKQHSPISRPFYMYLTSVIDTRSTAVTLGAGTTPVLITSAYSLAELCLSVEESILREHLRHADLM